MIRWMCGVSLRERQLSTELQRRIGNGGCNDKVQTDVEWTRRTQTAD